MIFITAKFQVRPEDADRWPEIVNDFTQACRKEPGCLWFGAHVNSAHFKEAQQTLPPHLVHTPKIISQNVDQDDWSELGELAVK